LVVVRFAAEGRGRHVEIGEAKEPIAFEAPSRLESARARAGSHAQCVCLTNSSHYERRIMPIGPRENRPRSAMPFRRMDFSEPAPIMH
jgi:hypothetical protein